jgi:hypothetical protein
MPSAVSDSFKDHLQGKFVCVVSQYDIILLPTFRWKTQPNAYLQFHPNPAAKSLTRLTRLQHALRILSIRDFLGFKFNQPQIPDRSHPRLLLPRMFHLRPSIRQLQLLCSISLKLMCK